MANAPRDRRTVLVTGGARRIGRAICLELAAGGYDVIVHHRTSVDEAEALAAEIEAAGQTAWTVQADLTDPTATARLVADVEGLSKRPLTAVVNNASEFPEVRWDEAWHEDLDRMMRIHAWAPWALIRALHQNDKQAAVVNLVDARIASFDRAHFPYWLSKRALADLTRALAIEVAPGIRVNAVAPGAILQPESAQDAKASFAAAVRAAPLARAGTPGEVAHAVRYLLEAEYVTGQTLFVDGGRHLRG